MRGENGQYSSPSAVIRHQHARLEQTGFRKSGRRYLRLALLLTPHALRLPRRFGFLHSSGFGEFACLSSGFAFGGRGEFGIDASLLLGHARRQLLCLALLPSSLALFLGSAHSCFAFSNTSSPGRFTFGGRVRFGLEPSSLLKWRLGK